MDATPCNRQTNFPLPAELREHIYSYALISPDDGFKDGAVGVPRDYIHLELLRLNRTIRDEVLHYFYKHDQLLYLEWMEPAVPDLMETLGNYRLPNVRNASTVVTALTSSVIRVRLTRDGIVFPEPGPLSGWNPYLTAKQDKTAREGPDKWQLVRLRDLSQLCQILKIICWGPPARYICIDSVRGAPVGPHVAETSSTPPPRFLVTFALPPHNRHPVSLKTQVFIFRELSRINGDIALRLEEFDGCAEVLALQCKVAPILIWPRALAWDLLLAMSRMKDQAEMLAFRQHPSALLAANWFFKQIEYDMRRLAHHLPSSESDPDPARCRLFYKYLKYDTELSIYQSWLMRYPDHTSTGHEEMVAGNKPNMLPAPTERILLSMQVESCLRHFVKSDSDRHHRVTAGAALEDCLKAAESQDLRQCAHLQNSVQVAREALDMTSDFGPGARQSLTDRMSSQIFPYQIIDTDLPEHDDPEYNNDHFLAWQDRGHIAMMSDEERDVIMALARQNGWEPLSAKAPTSLDHAGELEFWGQLRSAR